MPEVDLGLIAWRPEGSRVKFKYRTVRRRRRVREVKDHLEAIVDDDDSVEQETVAASTVADTFVIDHHVCLEFDPPSLRVPQGPREHFVRCAAGKRPERLRSIVASTCRSAPPHT